MYTIGEFSRRKGITAKALRFYESIGLLKPAYIERASKYRYYAKEQFALIDIIKAARAMDISPKALVPLFQTRDTARLVASLEPQKEEVKEKIRELEAICLQIEAVQSTYMASIESLTNENVYLKKIGERKIVSLPFDISASEDSTVRMYDAVIDMVQEGGWINTYQTGILFRTEADTFLPDRYFIAVRMVDDAQKVNVQMIAGGQFVCVNYSEKTIHEQQAKLNQYFEHNGIMPKTLVQVDLLTDIFGKGDAKFELQVLID